MKIYVYLFYFLSDGGIFNVINSAYGLFKNNIFLNLFSLYAWRTLSFL